MKQNLLKTMLIAVTMVIGSINAWAVLEEKWSIDFTVIGKNYPDKQGVTIDATGAINVGGTALGSTAANGDAIDSKFLLQTGTTWLLRTTSGLYQGNGGGRAFGLADCKKGQVITIETTGGAPTVGTNVTEVASGTTSSFTVDEDGPVKFNLTRYYYIKSIKVEENVVSDDATPTTYTIKFVDEAGGVLADDITVDSYVGETATASAANMTSIKSGDKKYIYKEGNQEITLQESADANVITLVFREAANYSYTVNAVVNGTTNLLATGSNFEGESVSVAYPQYINVNETLYETSASNKEYRTMFTADEDNKVVNLEYTVTGITNVVFFSEGENIDGATATSAGDNMPVRSSNAACGYAANDITIATLAPGTYNIVTRVYANSSAGMSLNFTCGDNQITVSEITSTNGTTHTDAITVKSATEFVWNASGSAKNGLDYIYIVKTGDATEEVTIGSAGAATYAPKANVLVPAEVKAYTVTVNSDQTSVTITEVNGALQAGKGYVIEGAEGTYSFTYAGDAAVENNANDLVVAEEGGKTAANDDNLYVLAQREDGSVGFSKVLAATTISAGKAYLDLGASAAGAAKPAFLTIGQPTAVEGVESAAAAAPVEYISLQGIKTTTPKSGVYIVNGKAVLVK